MNNKRIMEKADVAISDLTSNGGYLTEEQSNVFLRKLMDEPTMLKVARQVVMSSPQKQINKIGFGARVLRPGISGGALSQSDRAKPDFGKVVLNTSEVIAEVRIPYDVIEENIERGSINETMGAGADSMSPDGIKGTIIAMLAQRAALDLEELALFGDTANVSDAYLALMDGWLKLSTAHIVNGGGVAITRALFKSGVLAMPPKYMRNPTAMSHYIAFDQEINYRDTLAEKNTPLGDSVIQGTGPVFGQGIVVKPVALMPHASGLLCNPQNLIFGVQRQIQIETDKNISERVYIIVLTAKVDFKVEEIDAVVKYTNIL